MQRVVLCPSYPHAANLQYELQLAPLDGWSATWWPAVYVAVVVVSLALALLVFLALLGK